MENRPKLRPLGPVETIGIVDSSGPFDVTDVWLGIRSRRSGCVDVAEPHHAGRQRAAASGRHLRVPGQPVPVGLIPAIFTAYTCIVCAESHTHTHKQINYHLVPPPHVPHPAPSNPPTSFSGNRLRSIRCPQALLNWSFAKKETERKRSTFLVWLLSRKQVKKQTNKNEHREQRS